MRLSVSDPSGALVPTTSGGRWPLLRAVQHAQGLNTPSLRLDSIDHNERSTANDQLARAFDAPSTSYFGVVGEMIKRSHDPIALRDGGL